MTSCEGSKVIKWFTTLNFFCKELDTCEVQRVSVPYSLTKYEIKQYLENSLKNQNWKSLNLFVLGNGFVGKSTLVQRLLELEPVCRYFFLIILNY